MPYDYEIDVHRRLVRVRRWGDVDAGEIAESYARIAADPRFLPVFNQLADLTGMEHLELTGDAIRDLSRIRLFGQGTRRAFVVSRDLHFGLLRVFEAHAEMSGQEVEVFRDPAAAERWLEAGSAL